VPKRKEYLTPAPPNLLDMRFALQEPRADDSAEVKFYRAFRLKSPKAFFDQLTGLEKAWLAQETAERELRRKKWAAKKAQALARVKSEEGEEEGEDVVLRTIEEFWALMREKGVSL